MVLQRLILLSGLMALAGCAGFDSLDGSSDSQDNPNAGRYSLVQDRGPSQAFSESDIEDVEVVAEPVSRQGNSDYTLFGKRYRVLDSAAGFEQEGTASWYGEKFHGHTTSNGETYDMYALSAAHTTLPLPTFVRVTNLENDRDVVVRVNDRGPFHEDRVIDLSYAAALRLGYAGKGTARVRIEALTPDGPTTAASEDYWVQFGAFGERSSADRMSEKVREAFGQRPRVSGTDFYRVRLGPFTEKRARKVESDWVNAGNPAPVLVRP